MYLTFRLKRQLLEALFEYFTRGKHHRSILLVHEARTMWVMSVKTGALALLFFNGMLYFFQTAMKAVDFFV